MKLNIGDIIYFNVAVDDDPSISKSRPVLVELIVKESDFIGRMHPEDFNAIIIEEIERLHS